MLLKYSGISFISGAVNHGFFSGERSLWTAAVGIFLFVVGAWMEHRSQDSNTSLFESLWVGTLLSIGLGFFTGGLQHFPDSPARSSWVVPLGFVISIVALIFSLQMRVNRILVVYSLGLGILVTASSWSAYQFFEKNPEWAAGGHAHGEAELDAHKTHGVEWHPKLSHFEENLHPNLSHPNRLSCLIFQQGLGSIARTFE